MSIRSAGEEGSGGDVVGDGQADAPVRGRLTRLDPQVSGKRLQQRAARKGARGAGADRDEVPIGREEAEAAQPRGAEDLRPVDGHPPAHLAQARSGR